MKDDLLKSVTHKVDVIESHLLENNQAVEKLRTEIKTLKEELNNKTDINNTITTEMKQIDLNRNKFENESEQYSRANNIKIQGIQDTNPRESARESAEKVIRILKDNDICNITMADIDIAHSLPNKNNTNRDIIVRLVSRQTKGHILANRKKLRGTHIFINEDMTSLNLHVLMCVKKKMADEVCDAWFSNGKILFKSHMNKIQPVKFEEYEHLINLPWPSTATKLIK
ncbi:hypothetical protein DPMN_117648 [Dreissena polymorpha]|uniref:Uncharacterized protein n=1 Tax=Dreissena polymorpha TaxID=45954 RepID=A0A9D4JMS9_DREPO|nr:hypothetical protein DPMN_117648 [Dreissena polymorpha]